MKISKRLKFIEKLCDKCKVFLDVGTDHGYVPYLMLLHNKAYKVIASDIREKPLNTCKDNLSQFVQNKIDFRIGDGLSVIGFNEANGICICGIGYDLLINILKDIDLYNFDYMVLSPHTKIEKFKEFLKYKKLFFNEFNIVESGKKYHIFKVRRSFLLYIKDKFIK